MREVIVQATSKGFRGLVIDVRKTVYKTAPYCTEETARFIASRIAEWSNNPARLSVDPAVSQDVTTKEFAEEWRSRTWS